MGYYEDIMGDIPLNYEENGRFNRNFPGFSHVLPSCFELKKPPHLCAQSASQDHAAQTRQR